jgi:hypothetical protein
VAERLVSVEFVFERTSETSLAQAYRILVPDRRCLTAQKRVSEAGRFPEDRTEATEAEVIEIPGDRRDAGGAGGVSVELWVAQA